MTRSGPASALAISGAIASAAGGSFAKSLIEVGWSVGTVTLLRMGLAAIALAPVTVWFLVTRHRLLVDNFRAVVVIGALGAAGTAVCYFNALALLPVGIAMMGLYTSPVMVLVWVWVRGGRRPDARTLAGAALAVGGVVLVVLAMGVDTPSPQGMAWALAGALCLACFFVCAAQVSADTPAAFLAGAGLVVASMTVALLGLIGVVALDVGDADVVLAGEVVSAVWPIVLLVLVPTLYTYVASLASVKVLGARLASFLGLVELLAAIMIAWILLGEQPRGMQLVGGTLIICGVMLVRSDRIDVS